MRMNVKIHMRGSARWTLDSTPIVHNLAYCTQVGFVNRVDCPVRPEGHPEREACEEYAVGHADDTGRQGPTWYRNGLLCDDDWCSNHPDNQYLLWIMSPGTYEACPQNFPCGSVYADP